MRATHELDKKIVNFSAISYRSFEMFRQFFILFRLVARSGKNRFKFKRDTIFNGLTLFYANKP